MDRQAIKQHLPHREPMLLIDEVELVDGKSVAAYTVRGDEFFLQGHFPGNPVVPGVILCEMMGQSACLLIEAEGSFTPYFTGMNNVRFKEKVLPGDRLRLESQLTREKKPFYFISCHCYVGEKLCASGDFSFAVI